MKRFRICSIWKELKIGSLKREERLALQLNLQPHLSPILVVDTNVSGVLNFVKTSVSPSSETEEHALCISRSWFLNSLREGILPLQQGQRRFGGAAGAAFLNWFFLQSRVLFVCFFHLHKFKVLK